MREKTFSHRSRQVAERRGRRGEILACLILLLKGYRILGRRIRTHVGEIDLVARSPRGVLCFIEVKVRDVFADAVNAVAPRQQARITRAAEHFLAQRPGLRSKEVRFDAVVIVSGRLPRHLKDAWRP